LDEDFWQPILEPYENNPGLAFGLAQTFVMLQRSLAKGRAGRKEVIQSLENAIRELYPYTHFHQACLRLYARATSPEALPTHLDPTMLVDQLDKPGRKRTTKKRKSSQRRARATLT
jgi:hypothetical protein